MNNDIAPLQKKYPWPNTRPYPKEETISQDGGGRELISQEIARRSRCVVLEIGSFLGGSARRWLAAAPDSIVICIDPWEGDWWSKYALSRGNSELASRFAETQGPMKSFFTNMWDYRDRIIPVQGYAPGAILSLHCDGIVPDVIYFDSDKSGAGLLEAIRLFPNALITGDDWSWGTAPNQYPIRAIVREAARQTGRRIVVRKATWLLTDERYPTARQLWDRAVSVAADVVRPLRATLRK